MLLQNTNVNKWCDCHLLYLSLEYKTKLLAVTDSNLNVFYTQKKVKKKVVKAELLQEGIFFPPPIICQRRFSNEKVGNRKN